MGIWVCVVFIGYPVLRQTCIVSCVIYLKVTKLVCSPRNLRTIWQEPGVACCGIGYCWTCQSDQRFPLTVDVMIGASRYCSPSGWIWWISRIQIILEHCTTAILVPNLNLYSTDLYPFFCCLLLLFVRVWCRFQQFFSHIMTVSGCNRELNAHFYSAASLKYHAPDTWHDTTPSHIILTLGWPVLALPSKSECQVRSS